MWSSAPEPRRIVNEGVVFRDGAAEIGRGREVQWLPLAGNPLGVAKRLAGVLEDNAPEPRRIGLRGDRHARLIHT